MNFTERLIALIAPHRCVSCGLAGRLICQSCIAGSFKSVPSRCYRCHRLTRQNAVCKSCRSSVNIGHVWVGTSYETTAKEVIYRLKFKRAKAGAEVIAEVIDDTLPRLPDDLVVSHIPTASSRIRVRGYDQGELIARHLSKRRLWKYEPILIRIGRSRQVGSARRERFKHLQKALELRRNVDVSGKHVLLIDDVTTTGATIETAAKLLKTAAAKKIDVAVFAQP
ncbi:MAG TPA: phosphoribosyltransferase family protein [Candidatus Saccharimonadales bacterium]|nr:phosphoribosyltransferase family protein [Candidatus Saccharimonadales bacterium]